MKRTTQTTFEKDFSGKSKVLFLLFLNLVIASTISFSQPVRNNLNRNSSHVSSSKKITNQSQLFASSILLDSIYRWKLDTASNNWNYRRKTVDYSYDSNSNETFRLDQTWDGSNWVNAVQYFNDFDVAGNNIYYHTQTWSGTAWENQYRDTFTYDINNNRLTWLDQMWNINVWDNFFQNFYSYDSNNNMTSNMNQFWGGSAWAYNYLDSFAYDINNYQTNIIAYEWDGNSWENSEQQILTYDTSYNLVTKLSQSWDTSAWADQVLDSFIYDQNNNLLNHINFHSSVTGWDNFTQIIYTYDTASNLITETSQDWDWIDTVWINNRKNTYTYDSQNNMLSDSYDRWLSTNWSKLTLTEYTYDADDNRLTNVVHSFSASGNVNSADSIYYFFHLNTTGVQEKIKTNDITVFPNPFREEMKIFNRNMGSGEIMLFDMLGNIVLSTRISNGVTALKTGNIKPGNYLLRCSNGVKEFRTIVTKY